MVVNRTQARCERVQAAAGRQLLRSRLGVSD